MVLARGTRGRGWVEVGKEGEMGASVIVSIINIECNRSFRKYLFFKK